ncbi:M23 family metallopeptidase [Hoeflea sp. TYP-13]|uniref:M23 family metallopeptidase n=1 Tax=Hoeflea sp. TYP-13 TaxID=3230023 RepID=UPI0034C67BA3
MPSQTDLSRQMGEDEPLLADGRKAPDRREISIRWLSGTFLTGVTSSALMGIALFAALDGREQLAIPGEAYAATDISEPVKGAEKGSRLVGTTIAAKPSDKAIVEISTMINEGDRSVIRSRPFAHVKMALAANHTAKADYPKFDPLKIFSSGEPETEPESTGVIYGAEVESEISLKTTDFPIRNAPYAYAATMSAEEAEEVVRTNGSILTDETFQVAMLHYVDPQRFAGTNSPFDFSANLNARVVAENVSVASALSPQDHTVEFIDDVIAIREDVSMVSALTEAGYHESEAKYVAEVLSGETGSTDLREGDVFRIGLEQRGEDTRIVRASVYEGTDHVGSVAVNDFEILVSAEAPPSSPAVETAFDETPITVTTGRELPRVYDGIYKAALSYGMNADMTDKIVRLLASNVDYQARLKPTDTMEAIFSVDKETKEAARDSELLYLSATFGSNTVNFYRFRNPEDGSVDYYDDEGRSARQFLLRNPLPNGRFRSGFGMRRHPIIKVRRMHTGVDWAAPRGTPIIAAGNGVVEKAGWNRGYGKQTLIRHANGYVSSYSHQTKIAKGIAPGARVRQGQVIGYVGSTGLSTGPHLHYELIVNGTKVDPMRVRLPDGKTLSGNMLAAFQSERERIDQLIGRNESPARLASAILE